jgi:hypothetical protein
MRARLHIQIVPDFRQPCGGSGSRFLVNDKRIVAAAQRIQRFQRATELFG